MGSISSIELGLALRNRLEADAILGADVLPVRMSAVSPQSPVTAAPIIPARSALSPEEIKERTAQLTVIDDTEVKGCTKCGLSATRTKTVFGAGSPAARIMFIGEAPGHDEDVSGKPFVGRAGQLLTDMIQKGMGLKREDVYICNVLKCRPPNNRTPASDEIAACRDYLWRQIQIVHPEVIVALGAPAAQTLLGTSEGIGRLRSRWHDFHPSGTASTGPSIPIMPTYHPAYLLRYPNEKGKAWADLKMVMTRLGIPILNRR